MSRMIDNWRLFMQEIPSPASYIDFGFYYLINAALQRRVWLGPKLAALYPNMYIILIGEPSVGKGLVIKQVAEVLKYHKLETPKSTVEPVNNNPAGSYKKPDFQGAKAITPEQAEEYNQAVASAYNVLDQQNQRGQTIPEKPLLIPVAADATTYEALIRAIAKSKRIASYKEVDKITQKEILKNETHSSICFCLEEISSLFRKHTEDLVGFLLQTFDCGDYKYDTKTQGTDTIRRCCVNILGGTTPGFVRRIFSDELITEGFASRTVFVFESSNRFNRLLIPEFTPEQLAARESIIRHIYNLSKVFGPVRLSSDAFDYLNHWWCVINPTSRPNKSTKLNPYYGRKNIHVQKLAMSIHFADSCEPVIEKRACEEALETLDSIERRMHQAVSLDNKNPLSGMAREIKKYINRNGPQTYVQLLLEFYSECVHGNQDDLTETLKFLVQTDEIKFIKGEGKEKDKYGPS